MKKVVFVLTDPTTKIVGGYKVVYTYANVLSKAGVDVEILYRCYTGYDNKIKNLLNKIYRLALGILPIRWFPLSKNVKRKVVFSVNQNLKDSIIVATSVVTALEIKEKKLNDDNVIVYLIQDYETWVKDEETINRTFCFGYNNLTVAKWLEDLVFSISSVKPHYIPNGIDTNIFYCYNPFLERYPHSVAMLYHTQPRKGCEDGLRAIYKLKKLYPDLRVDLFGSPNPPSDLPDWVNYTRNASPNKVASILNNNRIYLMPSKREGFGLTGLEAINCGCVLITTPCEGIKDYAINNYNSFVSETFDSEEFVKIASYCFENQMVANQISNNGYESGRLMSIEKCNKTVVEYFKSLDLK